ncbi:MAG: hypothetical protein E6J37_02205 [Chloroflexi bacterium]|nr:MAG: hypothetical protein E6J37_02205 [Chloroflexota bacterium]
MKRILGGAGAAIVVKALTGFAVAALAATAAGAATEATITGSLNPADWGQQVKQQVAACKAELEAGQHGIGQCVSAFASQHGKLVSAEHRASGARENHGNGNANANGHAKDKSNNGNGKGKGNGHGNGQTGNKPDNSPEVESGG